MSRVQIISSILLIFAFASAQAQIVHPATGTSNAVVSGGETFLDFGEEENYENYEDGVTSFCPSAGGQVTLSINEFAVEEQEGFGGCYDIVTFYDGSTTGAPVIFAGCGDPDYLCENNLAACIESGDSFTSTSDDGCLTVGFRSDASVTYSGWDMTVSIFRALPGNTSVPALSPLGLLILVMTLMLAGGIAFARSRQ